MFKLSNSLLLLFVLFVGVLSVSFAQDVTPVPSPTEVVIVQDDATPITGFVKLNTGEVVINLTTVLVGLATAFSVGTIGGIAGVVAFVNRVKRDDILKIAIERLYMSTPPAVQKSGREVVQLAKDVTGLVDELTDGVLPSPSTKEVQTE